MALLTRANAPYNEYRCPVPCYESFNPHPPFMTHLYNHEKPCSPIHEKCLRIYLQDIASQGLCPRCLWRVQFPPEPPETSDGPTDSAASACKEVGCFALCAIVMSIAIKILVS